MSGAGARDISEPGVMHGDDFMNGEVCADCVFYKSQDGQPAGLCRRYPPTPIVVMQQGPSNLLKPGAPQLVQQIMPVYSMVQRGDWCGEFLTPEDYDGSSEIIGTA